MLIFIVVANTNINDIVLHDNTSFTLTPYHNKSFSCCLLLWRILYIVKTFYSNRFHALNHHIKKYHVDKLHSLTEIVNFQDMSYLREPGEYVSREGGLHLHKS